MFKDFPTLKILVSHGGGTIPYQWARFEAGALRRGTERFSDRMRCLYYDTVLYNKESLEHLFKTVGTDRCLFGTEMPGTGSATDPSTGRRFDDVKPLIDEIQWLAPEEREAVLGGTAQAVFTRLREAK